MEKSIKSKVQMAVLRERYGSVSDLGNDLYLLGNDKYPHFCKVYCCRKKSVLARGVYYEGVVGGDLIILGTGIDYPKVIFSCKKRRIVCPEYSLFEPTMRGSGMLMAHFIKSGAYFGGVGLYSISKEEFVISPKDYSELVFVEKDLYHGSKGGVHYLLKVGVDGKVTATQTETTV